MIQRIAAVLIGAVFVVTGAVAGDEKPLTEDQAKRFAASLASVEALGKSLQEEGKIKNLEIAQQPKAGEPLRPYSTAVTVLREQHPADHAKLADTLKPHGFSTSEWGHVGDRVMIAYLALEMQEQDPRTLQMMEGMDASMMAMVPPEMRAQLETAFVMMETVKNAPEADKEVVASVKDELDAYMEQSIES